MEQFDREAFNKEYEYFQKLFPSDPDETLITDATRMLASAGQFSDIVHQITHYLRALAHLSSRKLETQPLLSYPTVRSLAKWKERLTINHEESVDHLVEVMFNRVFRTLTMTVNALTGFANLPRDVHKAVKACRKLWLFKDSVKAKEKLELAIDTLNRWQPKWLKPKPYHSTLFTGLPASKSIEDLLFVLPNDANKERAQSSLKTLDEIIALHRQRKASVVPHPQPSSETTKTSVTLPTRDDEQITVTKPPKSGNGDPLPTGHAGKEQPTSGSPEEPAAPSPQSAKLIELFGRCRKGRPKKLLLAYCHGKIKTQRDANRICKPKSLTHTRDQIKTRWKDIEAREAALLIVKMLQKLPRK